MASKLIALTPYEAQNHFEFSLREAYNVLKPKLMPPLKYIIPTNEEYLNLNRAIVYGVLCEPNLANAHIKFLHAIVNDGYCLFVKLLVQIVDELYTKLLEFAKKQLIWVVGIVIDVVGVGLDGLVVSLLRQIVGGDFSDGNLWLSYEIVNLLFSKWELILDEEPAVLGYALYTYLRLLADHYCLARNPKSTELKRKEIGFCVRMLREQFNWCMKIGRDLIRLLQDLIHIPDFRAIWRDLVLNPSAFGTPDFSDIDCIYRMRTSSRYFLLRITPEMETQLRFLLTHVKLGSQKRHQAWFARKFLFIPERETLISDIVRFICCGHHPTNDILQSDIIPRWAVIGWLLKSCTKKYIEASIKLSLFYDWLFFDERVDNFMSIEPAMLLMVNSLPRYVDMANSLLEFLILLVENFDMDRKAVITKGVSSAMNILVTKGVIDSLKVFTDCNLLSPFVRDMLKKITITVGYVVCDEPCLLENPSSKVPNFPLANTSDMEMETHVLAVLPEQNTVLRAINSVASTGDNLDGPVDDVANLTSKIRDSMKSSNKVGLQIVEKILLLCSRADAGKLGSMIPEVLACQIKKELDLAGYEIFSPLESLRNTGDADDEVQSVTAAVIRTFIFTQHPLIKDMLYWWSKKGCLVGVRLLSYALRLAYEVHEGGYEASFIGEINIDKALPLLKFHVEGYFAFMSFNKDNSDQTDAAILNNDKQLISKMIDAACISYRSIMFSHISDASIKETALSHGKLLSSHVMSSSLWKNKRLKTAFRGMFLYLSDLSLYDKDLILLLVSQLEHTDLLSIQMDLCLKRYAIFGEDVQNVLQIIRGSASWNIVEQYKFWSLIKSELIVSGFPVEELLLYCFFSEEFDQEASSITFEGLLALCSCHAPTPEIVGAIMLLPNNKFLDFAGAVLSHWAITNASMLSNSISDFVDKLGKKNENAPLDWGGIVINQSALLFVLSYLEAQGGVGDQAVHKLGLYFSDIRTRLRTRLGNPVAQMDTG